jgi:hypothetical protein
MHLNKIVGVAFTVMLIAMASQTQIAKGDQRLSPEMSPSKEKEELVAKGDQRLSLEMGPSNKIEELLDDVSISVSKTKGLFSDSYTYKLNFIPHKSTDVNKIVVELIGYTPNNDHLTIFDITKPIDLRLHNSTNIAVKLEDEINNSMDRYTYENIYKVFSGKILIDLYINNIIVMEKSPVGPDIIYNDRYYFKPNNKNETDYCIDIAAKDEWQIRLQVKDGASKLVNNYYESKIYPKDCENKTEKGGVGTLKWPSPPRYYIIDPIIGPVE